mmetsp:Transcript_17982/g.31530  ORF Transcript_17982/g.31530 Transcript_17982/m.31530 type:complete len:146 (+) Transcript_17982:227-664(+)
MDTMINNIQIEADNQVKGGLGAELSKVLAASLGAEVALTSLGAFQRLQHLASEGRCCRGKYDVSDFFWVPKSFARGAGALGLGYGISGHCPKIERQNACVVQGRLAFSTEKLKTKYTTYTDCFSNASTKMEPEVSAVIVQGYCEP